MQDVRLRPRRYARAFLRRPSLILKVARMNAKAYWRRIRVFRAPWSPFMAVTDRELLHVPPESIRRSEERYLRATRGCDPYQPEIVALAKKLGEGKKDKREHAEAIFDFVKNEILFASEALPEKGVVGTLKAGYGICTDKLNLLVALARAAGIPTRYRILTRRFTTDHSPRLEEEKRSFGGPLSFLADLREMDQVYAELNIDGYWVPAHPTFGDYEAAGFDLPIARLGFPPTVFMLQASTPIWEGKAVEGLPKYVGGASLGMKIRAILARGVLDYVNAHLEHAREVGKKKLEEMGIEQYIESKKKFYIPLPPRKE